MDPDRLTRKSQEAVQSAVAVARDRNHTEVAPAHLLSAMLSQSDSVVLPLLQRLEVTPTTLRNRVEEVLEQIPAAYGASGEVRIGQSLVRVLDAAEKGASDFGDDYVSTEHLLLALVEAGERVARLLADAGVTRDGVLSALREVRGSQRVTSQDPESTYEALEKYARDLTAEAREGKLDPVIGRDEEIRRTIQVLVRRTKNNPVLIGERQQQVLGRDVVVAQGLRLGLRGLEHPAQRTTDRDLARRAVGRGRRFEQFDRTVPQRRRGHPELLDQRQDDALGLLQQGGEQVRGADLGVVAFTRDPGGTL